MKKTIGLTAVVAISLALNVVLAVGLGSSRTGRSVSTFNLSGPPVQYLEKIAQIVTLKSHIADVLEVDTKGVHGAWIVKGDALLAVDISKMQVVQYDATTHSAVFRLPYPQVIHARVDQEKTRTYDVVRRMWVSPEKESRIRDDAMREAQRLVEFAAASPENVNLAKDRADTIIKAMYDFAGWSVDIQWGSDADTRGPATNSVPCLRIDGGQRE